MTEQASKIIVNDTSVLRGKQTAERSPAPRNLRLLQALLDTPATAPAMEGVTQPERTLEEAPTTEQKRGWVSRFKTRHLLIGAAFLAVVAIPSTVTSVYMAFVAADQYHSSTSFSVRSIDSVQASDILGMFSQSTSGSTVSDSYVLLDYILSERMVQMVDEAFGLERIFAPRGSDFFFGLGADQPIENQLAYWRSMVTVDFDHTSGIINLRIKAFEPETAQRVAEFVVTQGEKLINDLSITARNETLRVAQSEVSSAEDRLYRTRAALRNYRDESQEADPVEGAKLAAQLVGAIETQLVQLKTELSTALTQMGEDTPRVRVLRSQIASLETQLQRERQRFGSGAAGKQGRNAGQMADVAGRIQEYEGLQTQNEFAERAYTSSLAALEKARVEAAAKQRYLAVFIKPTLSEFAQYPHRIMSSLLVLLGSALIWAVLVMGYYNIRDRN